MTSAPGLRPDLRVLRIPAHQSAAAEVVWLRNRSTCLSDAIGGGNLEEVIRVPPVHGADGWCLYLDEDRRAKGLAWNGALSVVLTGLGCACVGLVLAGDALISGLTSNHDDTDVPGVVLRAAFAGAVLDPGPGRSRSSGERWFEPGIDR